MRKPTTTKKTAKSHNGARNAVSPTQIFEQLRQRIATRAYPPGMQGHRPDHRGRIIPFAL